MTTTQEIVARAIDHDQFVADLRAHRASCLRQARSDAALGKGSHPMACVWRNSAKRNRDDARAALTVLHRMGYRA